MEDYCTKQVLIIDDDETSRKLLRRILRGLGFQKTQAIDDGERAITKMNDQSFGLVLVDWHISGLTGLEFLKRIRQDEALKQTPILLITSEKEQANIFEAVKAGINGYITKPFSKHSIHQKINAVFQNLTTGNFSTLPRVLESDQPRPVSV